MEEQRAAQRRIVADSRTSVAPVVCTFVALDVVFGHRSGLACPCLSVPPMQQRGLERREEAKGMKREERGTTTRRGNHDPR
jgi:hypothetical protein